MKKTKHSMNKTQKRFMKYLNLILILTIAIPAIAAVILVKSVIMAPKENSDTQVTFYSNLGVVKETKQLELQQGFNKVIYGVTSQIIPGSVKVEGKDISVVEQSFQQATTETDVLKAYLNKEITVYRIYGSTKEAITGKLLSYNGEIGGQLFIQEASGKVQILSTNDIELPSLPEDMIFEPTLQWILNAKDSGEQPVKVSYLSNGFAWTADYVLEVENQDSSTSALALTGWASLFNNAGKSFENAKVTLVAGTLNQGSNYPGPMFKGGVAMSEMAMVSADSFVGTMPNVGQLFDYYTYDYDLRTDLPDGSEKQLELLKSLEVESTKEYVIDQSITPYWYWNGYSNDQNSVPVQMSLTFENSKGNGLGSALPAGTVRVFAKDSNGNMQFLGEDSIQHTAKDEKVTVAIGNAFDIVASKIQTGYDQIGSSAQDISYKLTIKNKKDTAVTVKVVEHPYGDWSITDSSESYDKESQNKVVWEVDIPADQTKELTYTIRTEY